MSKQKLITIIMPAMLFLIAGIFLFAFPDNKTDNSEPQYFVNRGFIFGTYYNIHYYAPQDLEQEILERLQRFDNSLSAFNPQSVISKVNNNVDTVTDDYFEHVFNLAGHISELSDGAFDLTVAPLVNVWGFGFDSRDKVSSAVIDSLLDIVGYRKVRLENHRIVKTDPRVKLDAGAIAKGYSCDVVAELLEQHHCNSYLVDIGGEIVCRGSNSNGEPWAIGIDKPIDDPTGTQHKLQAIVRASHLALATSGNYRQFYYDNGVRRSHTIDPRTGYPVNHELLSASVVAPTCAEADALATACMVLGQDKAIELISGIADAECMLICANGNDSTIVMMTEGMKKYVNDSTSFAH